MRASVVPALSLLLSGCVAVTTSGTEEAIHFSPKESPAASAGPVLKPYTDLPLAIEFTCPDRLATLTTSYVIPMPPVLPVGFANKPVSYLRIRMPETAENAIAQTRIVMPRGTAVPLSDARQSRRTINSAGTLDVTYILDKSCETLDGAVMEVAGISWQDRRYPPLEARLKFESRITGSARWWPPAMFNGGQAVSGGSTSAADR